MKCRICGCETPAGTKLCKDCAAARKRAFAATVTQPLLLAAVGAPSVSQPRFAPRPKRPRSRSLVGGAAHSSSTTEQRKAAVRRKAPMRRPATLWWIAAAALAIGTALILGMLVARQASGPPAADEVQPAPPVTTVPAEPAPPPTIAPPLSLPVEEELPTPAPRLAPRARKPVQSEPVASAPIEAAPAAASEPPRAAPPAPRPAEPVRTDPIQSLNEALRRCAREELFSRPGCEQAARSRYCGAAWGSIPQCPIGPATDHGQ